MIPHALLPELAAISFNEIWLHGTCTWINNLRTDTEMIYCIVVKYLLNVNSIIEWKDFSHAWSHVEVGFSSYMVAC